MAKERDENYSHVLKYTGIFGGVQGLNIIISLVRNKLVALLLGPQGMGLVSLFNTTANFISQATNLGIPFSAVKHVSAFFEEGDNQRIAHFVCVVRVWSFITAFIGMALCVMLSPLLNSYTFSWGDHTLHFVLLAPAIGLMAITGGETAILKGARRLRSLALLQIYTVLAALVITVPVYYFFGQAGIVPVIVLLAMVSMLLTVRYSFRLYPLQQSCSKAVLGEGMGMVRLGIAFVLAGVMGSGTEMLIRSFLNVSGDLDVVGLYNAGFVLTITYAGMVFSAMETDYFPRLSSVCNDAGQLNLTVNRQIEVSLLIMSPMLAMLIIALPVLLPLLYSNEFLPVIAMAQVAVFSMYVKSMSLPISYITLAKGNSVAYMCLEACYDLVLVVLIVMGYRFYGLYGTGVALSVSYLIDFFVVGGYAFCRYRYRLSRHVVIYAAVQIALGLAVYVVSLFASSLVYWTVGPLLCLFSLLISVYILHQKTSLWSALMDKLKARFYRHA